VTVARLVGCGRGGGKRGGERCVGSGRGHGHGDDGGR
jgi:hypothetical protein